MSNQKQTHEYKLQHEQDKRGNQERKKILAYQLATCKSKIHKQR